MLRRAQVRVPCWNSLSKASHWLRIKGSNFGGIFRDFPKSLMRLIIGTEDMYCIYIYIDFENGRWGISILLRLFTSAIKITKSSLPLCLPFCVQLDHLAPTLAPQTNVYRCVHVPGLWREADRLGTKRAPRCSKQIV